MKNSNSNNRARPGDWSTVSIPDLRKNPETMLFIVATINGVLDADVAPTGNHEKIICLKRLFKEKKLNQEGQAYLLLFLLNLEETFKRSMSKRKNIAHHRRKNACK